MGMLGLFKQGLEIVDKVLPDSEKERELEQLLIQAQMDGQIKLNLADAQSGDPIRTRWRPLSCIGLAVAFLSCPLALVANALFSIEFTDAELMSLQTAMTITGPLFVGVLGLRGLEKWKGVG